ncbi:ABC transporter ATP-binding protein [Pyrococcus furiosus DSM 3638]|uniref:ABC transporter (ATP-binding protein)-like protein n=3 Tax=Pyrococcus furiosus TaxID=2261 RepID=Q8U0D7_PYRFU|nr:MULTISPECIES: ABC transporter ATP-binding protein [Pyrococcus]AAL81779.1 ABC transporter (ATP-binding protein)-like protein [Pyrococcus furiosus DSM 3638]AFN04985.1 ABC transporter [Pyrococcus furiosus COM1]MDK2869473.1 ATP-binding cassette, subfamily bacterial [Pyrococcus sp.]QEK79276.1 ABC transporter ATP-binding protein [Pyrococcus furiosus DSM 3638]
MESNSTLFLIKRFIGEVTRQKKILGIILLSIIGLTLTNLASPYILRIIIDEYLVPRKLEGLGFITALYLLTLIGQWAFMTLQTYYIEVFGQRVLRELRSKLHEKMLISNLDFFKNKSTGDLVSRIINDTNMVNDVLVSGLLSGVSSILSLSGIIIAMFLLDVRLTLVTLTSVPLMVAIALYFGGKMRRAYRETREKIARISTIVEESVAGIETIKAFGKERDVEKDFSLASIETIKAYLRVAVYMGIFWPLMNITSLLSVIIVIAYGGYLAYKGAVSIGVVVAFIQYAQRFRGPINNVVSMYDSLQSALAALERIYEILDDENVEDYKGINVERLTGEIKFENVWFEYEKGIPVLKNINLHISPGSKVAIVGKTGAGKTTMINLILRFYDPNQGRILYDGIEGRKISRESLRKRIGYVPQETYLFPGTIMENILIGNPEAKEEDVVRICKELGIHDFIMKLPNGYETTAGEAGKLLSVGERQLISIARALLKDPDIVILDEALSSVDPKTESLVQRAMLKLMEGRTSIIIAHRLTITQYADKIVVLEDGKIVEEGSPQELLEKRGYFYTLYTTQVEEI